MFAVWEWQPVAIKTVMRVPNIKYKEGIESEINTSWFVHIQEINECALLINPVGHLPSV